LCNIYENETGENGPAMVKQERCQEAIPYLDMAVPALKEKTG
jgi:hypothetical protein